MGKGKEEKEKRNEHKVEKVYVNTNKREVEWRRGLSGEKELRYIMYR